MRRDCVGVNSWWTKGDDTFDAGGVGGSCDFERDHDGHVAAGGLADGEDFGGGGTVLAGVLCYLDLLSWEKRDIRGVEGGRQTQSNAARASSCAAGYLCSGARRYSTETITQGVDMATTRQKSGWRLVNLYGDEDDIKPHSHQNQCYP